MARRNRRGLELSFKRVGKASRGRWYTAIGGRARYFGWGNGILEQCASTIHGGAKKMTKEESQIAVASQMIADRQDVNGKFLLIDEFRALLLSLLPAQQVNKYGQIFCKLMDRGEMHTSTITHGVRFDGDCCYTFLGLSQTDPWNEEMRSALLQKGGLAGRIIPINEQQFKLEPVAPWKDVDAQAALTHIMSVVENRVDEASPYDAIPAFTDAPGRIMVTFKQDGLTKGREWFEKTPMALEAIADNFHEWDLVRSKILIQAAKVAAILAVCELEKHQTTVDANHRLKLALGLIGWSHLGNMQHIVELTEEGQMQDKIKHLLKRKGPSTLRDLGRYTNQKPYQIEGYIRQLISGGEIREQWSTRRKGVVKYRLTVGTMKSTPLV